MNKQRMCNRYIAPDADAIKRHWNVRQTVPPRSWPPRVHPRAQGPFIRADGGGLELSVGQWGLIPFFAKAAKLPYSTNNARSVELAGKPAFREPWKRGQRCIIPAESFDEPCWECQFRRANEKLANDAENSEVDAKTSPVLALSPRRDENCREGQEEKAGNKLGTYVSKTGVLHLCVRELDPAKEVDRNVTHYPGHHEHDTYHGKNLEVGDGATRWFLFNQFGCHVNSPKFKDEYFCILLGISPQAIVERLHDPVPEATMAAGAHRQVNNGEVSLHQRRARLLRFIQLEWGGFVQILINTEKRKKLLNTRVQT
jgi:hypothetical protein